MIVNVKLYSVLRMKIRDYDAEKGIGVELEGPDRGPTIKALLNVLSINEKDVAMVYVNDTLVKGYEYALKDGDKVRLFPALPSGG